MKHSSEQNINFQQLNPFFSFIHTILKIISRQHWLMYISQWKKSFKYHGEEDDDEVLPVWFVVETKVFLFIHSS